MSASLPGAKAPQPRQPRCDDPRFRGNFQRAEAPDPEFQATLLKHFYEIVDENPELRGEALASCASGPSPAMDEAERRAREELQGRQSITSAVVTERRRPLSPGLRTESELLRLGWREPVWMRVVAWLAAISLFGGLGLIAIGIRSSGLAWLILGAPFAYALLKWLVEAVAWDAYAQQGKDIVDFLRVRQP